MKYSMSDIPSHEHDVQRTWLWRETALLFENPFPLSHQLLSIINCIQLVKIKPKTMEVVSDEPKVTQCESVAEVAINWSPGFDGSKKDSMLIMIHKDSSIGRSWE